MGYFDTVFNAKNAHSYVEELTGREAQLWARLANQAVKRASEQGASPKDAVKIGARKGTEKFKRIRNDEGKIKNKEIEEAGG